MDVTSLAFSLAGQIVVTSTALYTFYRTNRRRQEKWQTDISELLNRHNQTLYGPLGTNGLVGEVKESRRVREERIPQIERNEVRLAALERVVFGRPLIEHPAVPATGGAS